MLSEQEMAALLDVLEYDALAAFEYEDPGYWTWERPLVSMKLELYRVREYTKRWKTPNQCVWIIKSKTSRPRCPNAAEDGKHYCAYHSTLV